MFLLRPFPVRRAQPRRRLAAWARAAALGVGALLVLASAPAPARADAWSLDALMHALGAHKSARARFHETKTLAVLSAPIESSGVLRFVAPDRLEMRTLRPKAQTVVVQAGELTLEVDGVRHSLPLDQHPEVAALVDGLRATLDGDLAGLRRAYRTRLRGRQRLWTLELVPRLPAARARVSEIDVSGSGAAVLSIAIYQADGDHSLMTLHEMPNP